MPKSAAERKREQRQRLKESEQFDAFKQNETIKQKERRNKRKANATTDEKELLRKKKREEVKKYRAKKKSQNALLNNSASMPSKISPSKAFKNRSSYGKAVARVKKNLPLSPNKCKAVVTKLAQTITPEILSPGRVKRQRKGLDEDVISKIRDFYERDDVSRQSPGIKDVITVRQDGCKEKIQVRHLYNSIQETYALFCEENGTVIGKSKFAELRPQHVLLSSKQPHNVCLCKYHENFILAVNALSKYVPEFPSYTNLFFNAFLCEETSEACWYDKCDNCKSKINVAIYDVTHAIKEKYASWKTWKEEGRLRKVTEEGTIGNLADHILKQVAAFKEHSYVKRMQAQSYQKARENSINRTADNFALLQIDFSENYTCIAQNEIQSYHWGQPQVSLFTISLWYDGEQHPIVIASDNLNHSKDTITAYLDRAFEEIPETVKLVHIWSDGPSSQFKNRYIAASLSVLQILHNVNIVWNYFATSHGKGPVDGIGGAIKRKVRSAVLREEVIVSNAQEFVEVASKNSKVKVILLTNIDIENSNDKLGTKEIFDNAAGIKNISKMHKIYINEVGKVQTSLLSSHVRSFYSEVYSSDSEDQAEPIPGSSKSSCATINSNTDITPTIHNIKHGTYVLVKFEKNSKKSAANPATSDYYQYAAICQGPVDEEGEVKVMILKVCEKQLFRVDDNDVSYVSFENIVQILPNPSIVLRGNRILYKFQQEVEVFEKA